ncbi:MAG: prolipoprotein diacylglyceryl transferase [Syntrophorhabdaceae bacterium]
MDWEAGAGKWQTGGVAIFLDDLFVLTINPILVKVGGIRLWYHGCAYSIGFLAIFLWMSFRRNRTGLAAKQVLNLSILFSVLSLFCGRAFAIVIQEWNIFQGNYREMLSFWHGGMALPGFIAGGIIALVIFCLAYKKRLLVISDEIVVPLCLLLALVQIARHINGETYGYASAIWWSAHIPYEGFRHPVAVYESLKYMIVGVALVIITSNSIPGQGRATAQFLLWSGIISIIIDFFQPSRLVFLQIGTGQFLNMLCVILGILLIIWSRRRRSKKKWADVDTMQFTPVSVMAKIPSGMTFPIFVRVFLFVLILLFCLTIPSGASRKDLRNMPSNHKNLTI